MTNGLEPDDGWIFFKSKASAAGPARPPGATDEKQERTRGGDE